MGPSLDVQVNDDHHGAASALRGSTPPGRAPSSHRVPAVALVPTPRVTTTRWPASTDRSRWFPPRSPRVAELTSGW